MKLWSFLLFCVVMTGFIYPVEGYWSWGGGFLKEAGFSDFAGSGIVHMAGAAAALAAVLLLGPVAANMASKGDPPHPRLQPAARDPGHPDPLDGLVRLQRWLPTGALQRR